MGTLGIITEVSLKCLPQPKTEATVVQACAPDESIRRVNAWGGKPFPLSATCHCAGKLWVRLSGAESAVSAAIKSIGGERIENGNEFWQSIRDHAHPFFAAILSDDRALWRLSVRSTAPPDDLQGEQLIEWGGALRWLVTARDVDREPIREWAKSHGGHATLFQGGHRPGMFTPLDATIATLHKRLKATFDPRGILNRGRLYADF